MKMIKSFVNFLKENNKIIKSLYINEDVVNKNICDYQKLKKLAKDLSDKMYCDRFGSCVHFAEEFVDLVYRTDKKLLNCFYVVEGYVETSIDDGLPQQHTWIELKNGEKIDPTFMQFTKYGDANYLDKIKRKYTGQKYYDDGVGGTWFSERRKKYPEWFFKNLKI